MQVEINAPPHACHAMPHASNGKRTFLILIEVDVGGGMATFELKQPCAGWNQGVEEYATWGDESVQCK